MTKIADTAPVACASCGGQYIDRRHVDFDAAWDGPVVNQVELITEGVTASQIDELVLCENCLREAFALLEYDELSDEERYDQAVRISNLEAMNAGQARYIDQLERALVAKKELPAKKKERARA